MKRIVPTLLASLILAAAGAGYASAATRNNGAGENTGSWYAMSDASDQSCYAAPRPASGAENAIAGPFRTEAQADSAAANVCSDMNR